MNEPGSPHHSLTVVVPVYNEAEALPQFLPDLIEACRQNGWEAIFVDDGSSDDSAKILAAYQDMPFVRILHHKVNRGYGGALKTGIANSETPYVVTFDGDGQHRVSDIGTVYEFGLEKDADLVVGNRGVMSSHAFFREMGKSLIRIITRLLLPLSVHDLNSGFKLYRTELAQEYLPVCPNSMAFSDIMTLVFISKRNLVLEHPIGIEKRKVGRSTVGINTAFDTIVEVISLSMLFNPLRIFLPLAILCVVIGLAWGTRFVLLGRGVSVGAMLAITLGFLMFVLGLIASQLSEIRMMLLSRKNREKKT